MTIKTTNFISTVTGLSNSQFIVVQQYLAKNYGLHLPSSKKSLIDSRLQNRTRTLGFDSTDQYIKFLFGNRNYKNTEEYACFIDLVTTHKTSFFRECHQFDFLIKEYLDKYIALHPNTKTIKIWSAGCSTGEEVYSIAMLLDQVKYSKGIKNFEIYGTDISNPALNTAIKGVYSEHLTKDLPVDLRNNYFTKFTEKGKVYYRFSKSQPLNKVFFNYSNLNKPFDDIPMNFDFIFCRNAIIYFDLNTQKRVINNLADKLKQDGVLFLGHSETAIGSGAPIRSVFPASYKKI